MPASPKCDLYRNRECETVSVCAFVCVCVTERKRESVCVCVCVCGRCRWNISKRGGTCSRPGSSSSLASRCHEATSSTHHWPGSPCPGWPQEHGSSGWPRRASWGGLWRPFWPGRSPGSWEYSQTSPQCYWASSPGRKKQQSIWDEIYFYFLYVKSISFY